MGQLRAMPYSCLRACSTKKTDQLKSFSTASRVLASISPCGKRSCTDFHSLRGLYGVHLNLLTRTTVSQSPAPAQPLAVSTLRFCNIFWHSSTVFGVVNVVVSWFHHLDGPLFN
jgi:hypothetical protein